MQLHTSLDGNDLFLHQDIREGRKQAGGVGGHLKLGSPLTIQMPGSEALSFEDLDDVIANFAEPYLENVRTLVGITTVCPLLLLSCCFGALQGVICKADVFRQTH